MNNQEKRKFDIKNAIKEGLLTKNPVLVQLLGLCSTLAVTTSALNAVGMGISVTAVLICSNALISLLRKIIPPQVRIAAYIVVISGFVTAVELVIKAYFPAINNSLGLFIPLIVVNCIILARAEAFASKNNVLSSVADGFFMGVGYTAALFFVASIREIFGKGQFFGKNVFGENYPGILMITTPAGAFICLGIVVATVQFVMNKTGGKKK